MRNIIGTIIYTGFIMYIGYIIGKANWADEREMLKVSNRVNSELARDLLDKVEYIPKTELHKKLIIDLHNKGISNKQIANMVHVHRTAVGKALKRWNIV